LNTASKTPHESYKRALKNALDEQHPHIRTGPDTTTSNAPSRKLRALELGLSKICERKSMMPAPRLKCKHFGHAPNVTGAVSWPAHSQLGNLNTQRAD